MYFTISAGSAQEIQKVTTQDGDAADFVGTSVAIDGNLAISGAPGEDENGAGAGAVYVFEQSGENGLKLQKSLRMMVSWQIDLGMWWILAIRRSLLVLLMMMQKP